MATLTAGAGSTTWTSAAFSGGAASTAADDVVVPTGASLTISAANTVLCRSLSVTGTGTLIFAATTSTCTIGHSTAGAGNVALSVSSSATITLTGAGTINFVSTSGTQQTITSGGKTLPSITINGAGSSYILGDALTMDTSNVSTTLAIQNGTFNTGNYNITGNVFNLAVGTKTITLGSSAISLARNGGALDFSSSTNLTMTANTAVITFTQSATVNGGGVNYNGTSFTFTGNNTRTLTGANTLANLTFTGTALKTNILNLSANQTITGTLTVTSNSDVNRVLVASSTRGTAVTISAATVVISNTVDFMDITGAGAATWTVAGTGATYLGDCQGNSGITFTTPATQTNTGATGSWSDSTKWTSRVPLPQDDVVINTGSGTITADMPRLGKSINFTGFTGTASFNTTTELYGSLTLASGMTLGANTQTITLAGRSSYTVTSAGKQFSNQIQFNNYGGTYTLQDALYTTQAITQYSGTLNTNNQTVTCLTFATSGTITRVLTFGTSTINLTSTAATTVWSIGTTGLTMSAASSTIVIATASGLSRTFTSGNQTYGTLTYTVANSTGPLGLSGSSTYGTINLASGRGLIPNASGTYAITGSITGSGSPNGYVYMGGDHYGASAPDSAALSIAGDMDFRQRMSFDSLTPAGSMRIASKFLTTGNQKTWRLYLTGGIGTLTLDMSTTGSDSSTAVSSISLATAGLSANTNYWIRFTREKSTGNVKFYYAADNTSMPSSWTQIGTTQVATTSNLYDSIALLTIGGEQIGTNSNPGRYYRSQLRNNILDDGTGIQFDANFATKTFGADTFTESSSNAATVTMANNSVFGDGRLQIYSGTPNATLTKPSGGPIMTSSDYVVVQYIKVNQPLSFWAGANGVDKGNNSGVYFTAPGTYRHQQSIATTTAATSVSVTLPSSPTAGNLLIAYVESAGSTGGGVVAPSGFTQAVTVAPNTVGYIYYKIATGSESTLSYSQTNSRNLQLEVVEYSGFTGTPTLDVTDSNSNASSATSLSTTATTGPTNTAQPALAVAMWGTTATLGTTISITNSFTEDFTYSTASGLVKAAVKELTSTAAVDTTLTWTTARLNNVTCLAVFKNVSATGNLSSFFEVF